MKDWLNRLWCDLNYRYCCSNQYLAVMRHEVLEGVYWSQQANYWHNKWSQQANYWHNKWSKT